MTMRLDLAPKGRGGGERQRRMLDRGTMSIGRGSANDWVLADPDQHLSRTHCMIAFEQGRYVLTDTSTNGLLINGAGEPTTRDSRIVLTDGDTIELGGYVITVSEVEEFGEPRASLGDRGLDDRGQGHGGFSERPVDPFASGGDPLDVDPFDDPLGRSAAPRGFSHPLPHVRRPTARGDDPFDTADRGGPAAVRPPAPANARPPGDDSLFRPPARDPFAGATSPDHADAPHLAFTPPRPIATAARPSPVPPPVVTDFAGQIDFDALLGDVVPEPMAHPLAPPAARAATPPPPVAHPPASGPDPRALLASFLDGAGVPGLDLGPLPLEEVFSDLGGLFRRLVAGTRDALMSRAELKGEMRVEQTMLRAGNNNALKFSVSEEEAVAALLRPGRPGYMPPATAIAEAFEDIRAHEMAVIAGMQAALVALLRRFDPATLEARLQKGGIGSILPGSRKARYWEMFSMTYKEIAAEAEDDFHVVLGREFARAYDAAQASTRRPRK